MDLLSEFGDRLIAGLSRRAVHTASRWAEMYRRNKDGSPWSLSSCPWAREWHDTDVSQACILKGAQLRATESMLTRGMFANDVLKRDVLYVLPTLHPDASGFSNGRFDSAVVASPYLTKLYTNSNVGHKRCGAANFYIRGGHSRSALKSVPVFFLCLDEIDEMEQDNIPLAKERTSGQFEKSIWELSTPTIEDHGIAKSYEDSSQEHYYFLCPHCGRWTELLFPDCLEIVGDDPTSTQVLHESFLKCKECKHPLRHQDKATWLRDGRWVESVTQKEKRGFSINQLYSMTVSPGEVAASYLKGQLSDVDLQEFWNSKMALPHTPKGSKLSEQLVNSCRGEHLNGTPSTGKVVTLGIDVGNPWNHYEVDEWSLGASIAGDVNTHAFPKVLKTGRCQDFEEFDTLMREYGVNHCVIDAHPERRKAREFASRFWGRVSMCLYANGVSGKFLNVHNSEMGEPLVSVDRTTWLDQALGRIRTNKISLPRDLPFEYVAHMCAQARILVRDQYGNPHGVWKCPSGKADHHAHARTYAEIALALASDGAQHRNGESPL